MNNKNRLADIHLRVTVDRLASAERKSMAKMKHGGGEGVKHSQRSPVCSWRLYNFV